MKSIFFTNLHHLVPRNKSIVKSAKAALLAAPYCPAFVWLATMGLRYPTAEHLAPLRGRRIVLFPDAGALAAGRAAADELRELGFDVTASDELERLATADERAAGLSVAGMLLAE